MGSVTSIKEKPEIESIESLQVDTHLVVVSDFVLYVPRTLEPKGRRRTVVCLRWGCRTGTYQRGCTVHTDLVSVSLTPRVLYYYPRPPRVLPSTTVPPDVGTRGERWVRDKRPYMCRPLTETSRHEPTTEGMWRLSRCVQGRLTGRQLTVRRPFPSFVLGSTPTHPRRIRTTLPSPPRRTYGRHDHTHVDPESPAPPTPTTGPLPRRHPGSPDESPYAERRRRTLVQTPIREGPPLPGSSLGP